MMDEQCPALRGAEGSLGPRGPRTPRAGLDSVQEIIMTGKFMGGVLQVNIWNDGSWMKHGPCCAKLVVWRRMSPGAKTKLEWWSIAQEERTARERNPLVRSN